MSPVLLGARRDPYPTWPGLPPPEAQKQIQGRAEGSCSQPAAAPSCPPSPGSGCPTPAGGSGLKGRAVAQQQAWPVLATGLEASTPFSSLRPRMDSKASGGPCASSQLPTGARRLPRPVPDTPPAPLEPHSGPQTSQDSGSSQPVFRLPGSSSHLGWAGRYLSPEQDHPRQPELRQPPGGLHPVWLGCPRPHEPLRTGGSQTALLCSCRFDHLWATS